MSPEGAASAAGHRLRRLSTWFDPETVGVVTILFGLFQVLLSLPLSSATTTLPKLYILPFVLGVLIVAGGSLTMANEKNPSRQLLRGCAFSNVVSLLGALLAFCLYCYNLISVENYVCIPIANEYDYMSAYRKCPAEILAAYRWSLILMLILYDTGAVVLNGLLFVSALKAL